MRHCAARRRCAGSAVAYSLAVRGADIAVIFFAGHGIEVDGRNWLIPVDAILRSDTDIEKQAVGVDALMQLVREAHFGLIILDACRDNPFAATIVQVRYATDENPIIVSSRSRARS
jgi:uncharacterized caspase-like protein